MSTLDINIELLIDGYVRIVQQTMVRIIPTECNHIVISIYNNICVPAYDIVVLTSSPLVFGNDPYRSCKSFNVTAERDKLFDMFKSANRGINVVHNTATLTNIVGAITKGCRCIHYVGNAYPSYIALEDTKSYFGATHLTHQDFTPKVCQDEDQSIDFAFVFAGRARITAEWFVAGGIPHVIAIYGHPEFPRPEYYDKSAHIFTRSFYHALLHGKTIENSFAIGKNAVTVATVNSDTNDDKFLLLPEKTDHKVKIFCNFPCGEIINHTFPLAVTNLPAVEPLCIGRNIDMYKIIKLLSVSFVRSVVIVGIEGIGKSITALKVAKYMYDRNKFQGGVFFIDIKKLCYMYKTLSEMLFEIFKECGVIPSDMNNEIFDVFLVLRSIQTMGKVLFVLDGWDDTHENEIKDSIQCFCEKILNNGAFCDVILLVTTNNRQINDSFMQDLSRNYILRNITWKYSAKLFSRICNRFHWKDVFQNHELMHILGQQPKQIIHIAEMTNKYRCDTLEKVIKAYNLIQEINQTENHDKNANQSNI